ncbi:Zinc finger C3HC4 type (RING finger) protein [Novymonas esmeraldas]|uniref:Zinc finger C3HC4 type (RING finger) protein n=1 Tax=Novymonas esmeraldas TaxID=1808958 RepID=A0AAW0ESG3_9TRYP
MAALCVGEDFSEELTCAVCLDSWKDPIELAPCGHIFCKECASGLKDCPVCRDHIASTKAPNRTLVNMALQIRVKCMRCGWKGKREQGMSHVCGNEGASPPSKQSRPTPISPPQPPQHPTAVNFPSPYTYRPTQQPSYSGYASPPAQQPPPSQRPQEYPDLWQSGAPTQPPPHGPGFSGVYPGAAPPPNGSRMGHQGGRRASASMHSNQPVSWGYVQPPQPPQQQQQQNSVRGQSKRYQVIEPMGSRPWTLYGLDQSEYDQIVSLFVFFDEDESGALDRNEVSRLARWLNFANTPQDVQRIFNDMDADGSGSLSLGEFLTWLCHNKPNPTSLYGLTQSQYNTIMMQFHTYDTNQDGCLEMNEFTRLVLNLRDMPDEASARRLFQMIDRDRDGAISLHEFLTFRAGKG